MAEYLNGGGEAVVIWLMRILNVTVELEVIPDTLNRGVIVPVYKGGGRDPLKTDSYRGIILTSMISKVLEFVVLERLEFVSAGLPHINQSAYRSRGLTTIGAWGQSPPHFSGDDQNLETKTNSRLTNHTKPNTMQKAG